MNFDDMLQWVKVAENPEKIVIPGIPKDWAQGRTAFGGASTGLVAAAMNKLIHDGRVMRSIAVNFVGPIHLEKPFTIQVEKLREGRNVTHTGGRIMQDDKVCLIIQACYGFGRSSKLTLPVTERHEMQIPKKPKFIPQIPKVVPKFLRHFELAIEKGLPFTGRKDVAVHGWVKFKEAPDKITDAHTLAMIDAWPPTMLQNLRWPAPASSLSWYVDFLHPHKSIEPADWFAYQAEAQTAGDGYIQEEANFWNAQGELVAVSRQTVAVFD
ncbi:acyl-CoA thioesterase [Alteromonas sp. a30]|uniref:acyl-CoA thioesterase n=1 Tax=Alteromonas sp. a30 TaxID=2730917 RepID=UPI0022804010|nr:thioesterase family protein [Alteromonas sp. a30]MCY7294499.1 thioesterase family protein [Alteromonas sp. a30]